MATQIGVEKIAGDNSLLINGGASTVLGAATAKGSATDLLMSINVGPVNTTAVAGTVNIQVQGSNVTSSALTNWTSVAADKGTLPTTYTASALTNVHFQNLQFAFYRLQVTGTATATLNTVYNFQPMADSFDATVA